MNREIAAKWIADLRSNPPQAKNTLFNGTGHCCLGRLCVLAGIEPKIDEDGEYGFLNEFSALPPKVQEWAGMKSKDGSYDADFCNLSRDNDSGCTFAEIADIIEAHVDEL